jgi:hypothetical protein
MSKINWNPGGSPALENLVLQLIESRELGAQDSGGFRNPCLAEAIRGLPPMARPELLSIDDSEKLVELARIVREELRDEGWRALAAKIAEHISRPETGLCTETVRGKVARYYAQRCEILKRAPRFDSSISTEKLFRPEALAENVHNCELEIELARLENYAKRLICGVSDEEMRAVRTRIEEIREGWSSGRAERLDRDASPKRVDVNK